MMRLSSRAIVALLAAGVVVLGFALWFTSRPPSAANGEVGRSVLPRLSSSLNSIVEVRLTNGQGKKTTLEKRADDWIVAQRGYRADSGLVRKLLIELARLKVIEQKTSNPARYAVIGVEPVAAPHSTGTRIDLIEPHKTVSLIVGDPSGDDASFVRLVHAKGSLLVSPQIRPQVNPKNWLDDAVVNLPESRVEAVRVEPSKGRAYTVARGSPKQLDFKIPDLPRGRQLSSVTAANSVASALTSLTLSDVRKHKGGQSYTDHATYRTFHGLTIEVDGLKAGKSRYIALTATTSPKASKAARAQAKRINARLGGWQLEILGYQYESIFHPLEALLKPLPPKHHRRAARHHKERAKG